MVIPEQNRRRLGIKGWKFRVRDKENKKMQEKHRCISKYVYAAYAHDAQTVEVLMSGVYATLEIFIPDTSKIEVDIPKDLADRFIEDTDESLRDCGFAWRFIRDLYEVVDDTPDISEVADSLYLHTIGSLSNLKTPRHPNSDAQEAMRCFTENEFFVDEITTFINLRIAPLVDAMYAIDKEDCSRTKDALITIYCDANNNIIEDLMNFLVKLSLKIKQRN